MSVMNTSYSSGTMFGMPDHKALIQSFWISALWLNAVSMLSKTAPGPVTSVEDGAPLGAFLNAYGFSSG
jgi:hypothetical protein